MNRIALHAFMAPLALLAALQLTVAASGAPIPGNAIPDLRTRSDGSDWPGFLGPGRDGRSSEKGILTHWPEGGPAIRWQRSTGDGYSSPATSLGRLFFFDRHGDRARLTCLESETGKELWQREYETRYEDMYGYSGGPRAAPLVDGDRIYTFGVEGRLRCQKVVDGSLLWEVNTEKTYGVVQNFFGVGASPVIEGDLLIAQVGGSPAGSPGIQTGNVVGNGSGIVAFDKYTGKERYRITDELASYSSPIIASIGERRMGLVFARSGLVGFEPRTGAVAFHFPWRAKLLESVNAATPVVVGDRVFLTETYGPGGVLLHLGVADLPEVVWRDERRRRSLACHWNTPIHHQGYLYGSSGRNSGDAELRAVELATGKVMWSEPGMRRASLLYVDGHFVVLGEYGELLLIRATPERFERVAEVKLEHKGESLLRFPAWNAPIFSQGLLYVQGKDRLVALELIPPRQ